MNFEDWPLLTKVSPDLLSQVRVAHEYDGEVFLVTNDDKVLACGTNKFRILGLGDTAPRFALESVVALNQKRVKGFVFGGYNYDCVFVIAHCFTGAVYMWGKNHGTDDVNPILKPTLMDPITKKVLKVACGREHCLLLNIDGEVFSWGKNTYGQLGINSKKRVATPTKIKRQLAGKRIAKISCGSYFSAAVLDSGEVFTWGKNDYGQLGVSEFKNSCSIPKKVSNLDDTVIKKIVCGDEHVLAVNDVGELYVWGGNACGQLGLGDNECRRVPMKNEIVGRVTKIASFSISYTSAAITENFKVFMWGSCAEGRELRSSISVPKETHYVSLHQVFANVSSYPIMYKSMTRQPRYESVNETLRNAFEDKESSDLIIVAEGKEIFVHRTILRLRSDYFRTLLQKHWVPETEKSITIDKSYNAIYAYLEYLYCGELKTEPMLALELLTLADEYNDLPLKKLCEKTIQCGITIENVASLYAIALKLDEKKFLKSCLSFAAKHLSELIDTSGFDEWDVITMKTFFRECRNRRLFKS